MTIFHVAPQRSGHIWVASMIESWLSDVEILDLEGHDPEQVRKVYSSSLKKGVVVIQTRDLLNWYASYSRGRPAFRVGAIPTWEIITDEYYHPHYFLGCNVVHVMYDDFVSSGEYRHKICSELGGSYNEEKIDFVPHSGSGSSFNAFEFQGKGSQMETLTRYKQVSKEVFVNLFRNRPLLLELYLEIVEDPEKIEFVKSLEL